MATLAERARELRPGTAGALARGLGPLAVAVGVALVLQIWVKPALTGMDGGDFIAKLLLDIGINVVLAVSLTMVNGFTGQFSIGHAAFMAVGGYVAAGLVYYGSFRWYGDALLHGGLVSSMSPAEEGVRLVTGADLWFAASLLAGGVMAAVCGLLVGLPSLRLKGDYLAIVTLGFGEIVRVLIQSQTTETLWDAEEIARTPAWQLPRYLGGSVGFSGLPFYTSLFWVALVTAVTLMVAYRLKESTFGRAFLSIREDEIAAEAMGVNTTRYKVWAFVISSFFAGVAGGLYAHTVGVQLNAGELGFVKSFDIIIMVVLGGLGSISGATVAAAIVTVLPEALREPEMLAKVWPAAALAAALGGGLWGVAKARGREAGGAVALLAVGVGGLLIAAFAAWAAGREMDLGRFRMLVFAVALILMMILRPQGLLGVRELWERQLWSAMGRGLMGGRRGRKGAGK